MDLIKNKDWKQRFTLLHEYSVYFVFFALPFPNAFISISLGIWTATWLLFRFFGDKQYVAINKRAKQSLILFGIWVLVSLLSILFTDDPYENSKLIERWLSFIILLIILYFGETNKVNRDRVVNAYIAGSLVVVAVCFSDVWWQYLVVNEGNLSFTLSFAHLSSIVSGHKHSAYLSLNLLMAFYLYISKIKKMTTKSMLISLSLLSIFGIVILAIQSRAGLIGIIIVACLFSFQYLREKKIALKGSTFLFAIAVLVAVYFLPINEITGAIEKDERNVLWTSSLELIQEKPIFGYGLGGAEEILIERTFENGFLEAKVRKLNAHNQFLESLLDNGLLGFVLIILSIILLFVSIQNKDKKYNFLFAMILIGVFFFFESMLRRIAGVSIFALIIYWYIINNDKDEHAVVFSKSNVCLALISLIAILAAFMSLYHDNNRVIDSANAKSYAVNNYEIVKLNELPKHYPAIFGEKLKSALKYDSTVTGWNANGGTYRHIPFYNNNVNDGDTIRMSAYCYVSKESNLSWARISVDGASVNKAKKADYYDMNRVGEWQKLEIESVASDGIVMFTLMFHMHNAQDFRSLNGEIIYALPQYEILNGGDNYLNSNF